MADQILTTFKMSIIQGDVTERMSEKLKTQKKRGQGNVSRCLHNWSTVGFNV